MQLPTKASTVQRMEKVMANLELLYPQRKRCATCRQYLGLEVIDGLYDSYKCAGLPEPSTNPDDWPREHFFEVEGVRRAKRGYISLNYAEASAKAHRKEAYKCNYCRHYHIGGRRVICDPCKVKEHTVEQCTNPTTCSCQHRDAELLADGTLAPSGVKKDVR